MQCARGTGADKSIALAVFQHRQALDQAGVGLVAHRFDGVIMHVDGLGAVEDGKGRQIDLIFGGAVADGGFLAQQHQLHAIAKLGSSLGSPLQYTQRGVVTAHGIH